MLAPLAAAVALAVCPPPGPVAPVADPDSPAPDALVACVGTSAISGEVFGHWLRAARKGSPNAKPTELRSQVMAFLINGKSLEGEATERGIRVSDVAVRRQMREQRQQAFPTLRAYRQFLADSGMTRSDIKYRVRLDILSARLQHDVAGSGSPRTRSRRLARFLARFGPKWKARTSCHPQYATDDCGHQLATAS